jgi:predicted transcriptional regulator
MCAVVRKSSDERKTEFFSIRLEPAMRAQLVELARQNERTLAGEIRSALRRYLEQTESAEAAA